MKLFGANWQTTVWGGLQALFTAFTLGTLTFPSDWSDKTQIAKFSIVVIGTFFGVNFAVQSKQKNVTGGTQQQTVSGDLAEPGTQTLVDATVIGSIKSGDVDVTREQRQAVSGIQGGPLQP